MAKVFKKFYADRAIKKTPPPIDPNAPPLPPALKDVWDKTLRFPKLKTQVRILTIFGVYQTFADYNKGVAYFDEQLKKGVDSDGKPFTAERYEAGVAHLRSTLIAQIAASTILWPLFKEITGWGTISRWLLNRSHPKLKWIGERMGTMNAAARAALVFALNTPEARTLWSDLVAGTAADSITDVVWKGVKEMINSAINGAKDITGLGTPDATNPADPAAADKNATSTNPTAPKANSTTAPPADSSYKGNPLFKGIKG